jgi:hypothetical protein
MFMSVEDAVLLEEESARHIRTVSLEQPQPQAIETTGFIGKVASSEWVAHFKDAEAPLDASATTSSPVPATATVGVLQASSTAHPDGTNMFMPEVAADLPRCTWEVTNWGSERVSTGDQQSSASDAGLKQADLPAHNFRPVASPQRSLAYSDPGIPVEVTPHIPLAAQDVDEVGPLLQPRASLMDTFWAMRPPDGEDGREDDDDDDKSDDQLGGDVPGRELTYILPGKCLGAQVGDEDTKCPHPLELQCRECELPGCDKPNLPTSISGPSRSSSCQIGRSIPEKNAFDDLQSFGIERQFEFGGPGWAKTAAELQPDRSVFFPSPPVFANDRVYHTGHHTKWKRRSTWQLKTGQSKPASGSTVPKAAMLLKQHRASGSRLLPVQSNGRSPSDYPEKWHGLIDL